MSKPKIAIVGYGETPFSRGSAERGELRLSSFQYIAWAAELALKSAGLSKEDLDNQGLAVGRLFSSGVFWGGEVAETLGITPKLIINGDHGGASGVAMLTQAGFALSAGYVDYVLCVTGDSPLFQYAIRGTSEAEGHRRDFERPFGLMGPNSIFSMVYRRHQLQYGTKPEHTGTIAVVQRKHANLNPGAYFYKKPLTMEEYLQSRMIAEPLRLLDCVMPVNGGGAFIVTTAEKASKFTDKPVYLLGTGECDNYYHGSIEHPDITFTGISIAARRAFEMAGLEPKDMNFFQPYDDYTIAVLMQLEDAGFCEKGKSGEFVQKVDISYDGELPVNTGGGQISSGQPGLAGGMVNILEGIRQLRGEGGQRQVKGCKAGMVTGIGMLQYGRNVGYNNALILGSEV
ncbi:MAG: thiolase family protein [Nitrososphaerales archaeon]